MPNLRLGIKETAALKRIYEVSQAIEMLAFDNQDVFRDIELDWEDRVPNPVWVIALENARQRYKNVQ